MTARKGYSWRKILAAAGGIGLVWQLSAWLVNDNILPAPMLVLQTFAQEIGRDLGGHFLASLWRVVASMLLSVALAAPAGLVLGQSQRLNDFFSPVIYLLYPIPKVVLVPVVLLFLGISDLSTIVIIFLILFFQILVLVRDQAAAIRSELVYSVRSLGAGRRGLFRFVYLPASIPAILVGAIFHEWVEARQRTGHPDGAAPIDRDGGGGAVYRRADRNTKGVGVLYLFQRQHPVRLPQNVRRGAGDEPAGFGDVFYC